MEASREKQSTQSEFVPFGNVERLKPAQELFGMDSQAAAAANAFAAVASAAAAAEPPDEFVESSTTTTTTNRRNFWTKETNNSQQQQQHQNGDAHRWWSAFDDTTALADDYNSNSKNSGGSISSRKISLQLATDENDRVESQSYTGILALEDLRYSKKTGRDRLPSSTFSKKWYQTAFFE